MDSNFLYELIGQYGIYAVFFLTMVEGDITLLLAGVLAHSAFFGEHSFPKVILAGTLGGFLSDTIAYGLGRLCGLRVREYRFYRIASPRIERLIETFGPLSIFLSKYVYGLRTASCVFYGVGRMRVTRFVPLALASCFVWVSVLSGAGYFFSGAITQVLGDFHQLGIFLLIIVVLGIAGFYLLERYWLSKKVEQADPERIQELEQAAQEKIHELGDEIKERINPRQRRQNQSAVTTAAERRAKQRSEIKGD
jgi:membrane protein DedA with SNARE-associated domain